MTAEQRTQIRIKRLLEELKRTQGDIDDMHSELEEAFKSLTEDEQKADKGESAKHVIKLLEEVLVDFDHIEESLNQAIEAE